MARTTSLTWRQFRTLLETWARGFLANPHALRIGGRPVCAFNNLADFSTRYGQATFGVMLRYASHTLGVLLGEKPYLLGVIGQANPLNAQLANALPLDGITGYGLLPNWLGTPIQRYAELIEERVRDWERLQRRVGIPFFPVVCAGWDATVRGSFRGALRAADGYPYSPVVVGVTAELFGEFLDHAQSFNQRWQPRENLVFLHAWNEWTESSVLEPSDRFGYGLLEEVRKRAFRPMPVPLAALKHASENTC